MSRRLLAWNSLSGFLYYLISMGIAFVMAPFLVHHLGNGGYGFWELIMGLVGYLGVLNIGVSPAVMRHVALASGEGNPKRLVQVINTGFATFICAGAAGALLLVAVSLKPALFFGRLPFALTETREVLWLGGVIFLLTFTRATFTASLMGLQYHRIVNSVRAVLTILQAVAIYLLLVHSDIDALVKMASVSAISLTVESGIAALILMRILKSGFDPRKASWKEGRELFGFGVKSIGLMSSGSLMQEGLLFVISHALGAAFVTFYVLCRRLVQYGVGFVTSVGYPITPYLATSLGHRGLDGVRESFDYTTRIMQFIQGGIAIGLFWLGLPFLAHWMGPQYALRGIPIFYLMAFSFAFNIFASNANRTLLSLNKHGTPALVSMLLAAVAFVLALVLVPRFGLTGAAIAAVVFQLSFNVVQVVLVCRAVGISVFKHIKGTIQRLTLPVLSGCLAMAEMLRNFPPNTYLHIFLCAIGSGTAYLLTGIFTVSTHAERKAFYAFARHRLFPLSAA